MNTLIRRTARLREAGPQGIGRGNRLLRRFSPASIPGLVAWYDATVAGSLFQDAAMTTPAVVDADPVGAWRDLSGNAHHATTAVSGQRPQHKTAVINDQSVLRFDGLDDRLSFSPLVLTAYTILIVQATTTDGCLMGSTTANRQIRAKGAANTISVYDGSVERTSTILSTPLTAWSLLEWTLMGGTVSFYQNAAAAGSGTSGPLNALDTIGMCPSLGASLQTTGDIAAIVIAAPFSSVTRVRFQAYAYERWGVG